MMQRMNGTKCPDKKAGGLRRGVVLLAALLLACVLMAGAVSAADDSVEVSTYAELIANLSKTESAPSTIKLTDDINAEKEISVNRSVTIDGNYHTIKAKTGWSQNNGEKDLLVIETKTGSNIDDSVTLKNISFESCGNPLADEAKQKGAYSIQVYNIPNIQMKLINLVVNGSQGSGINVNGGNVSLQNVTVRNSAWQSVDVSASASVGDSTSAFKMDDKSKLEDTVQINTDQPQKNVEITLPSGYTQYSFSYEEKNEYKEQKQVWATAEKIAGAAEAIATAKQTTFNATVLNVTDSSITSYHADLKRALENYVDTDATVTQLEEVTLTQPITITKPITFDGGDKMITGKSTNGFFLKVQVPKNDENSGKSVTLKNLNIIPDSIGGNANLGGITVQAANKAQSVPVHLVESTIDMSEVAMESGSMNPAVYFVSAPGSTITKNDITAGSTTGSSTRCVVVDGGSGIFVTGNTLNLGTAAEDAKSIGVQIKGSDPNDVTVTGNTITAPDDATTKSIAVDITTTGKGESHSITGNIISAKGSGKFDSAVRVLLASAIPDNGGSLDITVSGNTVTNAEKGVYIKAGSDGAKSKQLTLTGAINVDDFQELSQDDILAADPELPNQPNTDSVDWTHNPEPQPQVSSGDGNMNNAFRVLFETSGGSFISPATGLSYGDRVAEPANPVKDGYTFGGWYKDAACTQAWSFSDSIPGDMTLYAKWTSSAGTPAEATATATATAQTTTKATTAPVPTQAQSGTTATTAAPVATTAAGAQPTLTQAPAPVLGGLFGLLAAGVLLRRRE
ncbi:MAG: InlB B-repeat-containing protein [Methanocorpusculum sp.]|nr:InlB B-repeat-containing protein [Methanocorpusculum sp.]